MLYSKNRWFSITFIAFLLLLTSAIFVYHSNKKSKIDDSQLDVSLKDSLEEQFDNFRADNISIAKYEDNRKLFSISADKVIHRKRLSKLFVYQNLKEIYMSGVKLDIYPDNITSISEDTHITMPVDDIGRSFTSLGKPSTRIEEYLEGTTDTDLDLLTRILLEELSINIHLPRSKEISFAAKSARIDIDLENIILAGFVKIAASDGKELTTSQAIWSKKFNGIYLPQGYTIQKDHFEEKAFFTLTRKGKFSKASIVPKIDYRDLIEEREEVFYTRLFKKMPAQIKYMFNLPENVQPSINKIKEPF